MATRYIVCVQQSWFMSRKRKFTTVEASTRLLSSMEVAINNMIDEIRKPVDGELSGSQRKAELQSIKQTATDAKELLIEYQRLEQMVRELKETGGIEEETDYSVGFAERFSK
jgi:cell shape-determining protein MreC